MMMKEYNIDARQQQIKLKLDTHRPLECIAGHELSSISDGLTKLLSNIEELAPQAPIHAQVERNKI